MTETKGAQQRKQEKDRNDKHRTSDQSDDGEFTIAGNVRRRGEDPPPGDRARGERSSADHAEVEDARDR